MIAVRSCLFSWIEEIGYGVSDFQVWSVVAAATVMGLGYELALAPVTAAAFGFASHKALVKVFFLQLPDPR